jgi:L-2-hydroxyglutarate oxidase
MPAQTSIVIVGAGIVGLATALELTSRCPGVSVTILEKESAVATHQTGHNSGVIHSGIYYKPGSLKARLCVEGARALVQFCREQSVPYEICGKIILATEEQEFGRLDELHRRGLENGLSGLRLLDSSAIREVEPKAAGLRGLHVPSTGIVNYQQVAQKYAELVINRGATLRLSSEVLALRQTGSETVLETTTGTIGAQLVVNCAGLQSDRIRSMTDREQDLIIVPFRGEYYHLAPAQKSFVNGLIYPVPDPQFPFLGVHFTRRMGGGVEAGPNAVLALKREGYSRTSLNVVDVLEYATFPGFWAMASKHWRTSLGEYHRSWSKAAFVRALQRLVPELRAEHLVPAASGVRAQALDRQGRLVDDFHFAYGPRIVHVCNVPSPAATASLAIGKYIVDEVVTHSDVQLTQLT